MSLNPMEYWKLVLKCPEHSKPRFLIMLDYWDYIPETLEAIKRKYNCDFVLETETQVPSVLPHLTIRHPSQLTEDDRKYDWAKTDYIVCNKESQDIWLPAELSGVTTIFELKDFLKVLDSPKPLEKVERVINFEIAKSIAEKS